jgi:hypothetical protein
MGFGMHKRHGVGTRMSPDVIPRQTDPVAILEALLLISTSGSVLRSIRSVRRTIPLVFGY